MSHSILGKCLPKTGNGQASSLKSQLLSAAHCWVGSVRAGGCLGMAQKRAVDPKGEAFCQAAACQTKGNGHHQPKGSFPLRNLADCFWEAREPLGFMEKPGKQ